MKTRTIIATIAVAIIAGVSIFAACTKEEKRIAKNEPFLASKNLDQPWGRHRHWSAVDMECLPGEPFNCFDDVVVTPTSATYFNALKSAIQNHNTDDIVSFFVDGTYTYLMPLLDDYIIYFLASENTNYIIEVNEAVGKEFVIAKNDTYFTDLDSIHYTRFVFPFYIDNNEDN